MCGPIALFLRRVAGVLFRYTMGVLTNGAFAWYEDSAATVGYQTAAYKSTLRTWADTPNGVAPFGWVTYASGAGGSWVGTGAGDIQWVASGGFPYAFSAPTDGIVSRTGRARTTVQNTGVSYGAGFTVNFDGPMVKGGATASGRLFYGVGLTAQYNGTAQTVTLSVVGVDTSGGVWGGVATATIALPLVSTDHLVLEIEFTSANVVRGRAYKSTDVPSAWIVLTSALPSYLNAMTGVAGIYHNGSNYTGMHVFDFATAFSPLVPGEIGVTASNGVYVQAVTGDVGVAAGRNVRLQASQDHVVTAARDVYVEGGRVYLNSLNDAWVNIPLVNGATGNPQFRRMPDGVIRMRGSITRTGPADIVAILPATVTDAYGSYSVRPEQDLMYPCLDITNFGMNPLHVEAATGDIRMDLEFTGGATGDCQLDGMTYYAGPPLVSLT